MFEAICHAFGYDWHTMTRVKQGNIGRIARELRQATATPADIPAFYAWCKAQQWPDFTENALATRWDDFKVQRNGGHAPARPGIHLPPGVKDCPICGGAGFQRGAQNESVPCPACLKAEQEAQCEPA